MPRAAAYQSFIEHLSIRGRDLEIKNLKFNEAQKIVWQTIEPRINSSKKLWLIVLKARRLGMCLAPQTRVLTDDLRWVTLQEIRVGQQIVAVDEHVKGVAGLRGGRQLRKAEVVAKRDVIAPAFRLTMGNGETLIATAEHRFLAKKRGGVDTCWRTVQHTRVGDVIRVVTRPWGDADYEDGWMSGMLDGEGSLRPKSRAGAEITIPQLPGPVLDRARQYLAVRGYHARESLEQREKKADGYNRKPIGVLTLGRMDEIFRLIGQTRPSRFLSRAVAWWEGKSLPGRKVGDAWVTVERIDALPVQPMIDLQTTAGTFIAEGFVSHNSTLLQSLMFSRTAFSNRVHSLTMASNAGNTNEIWNMAEMMANHSPFKPYVRKVRRELKIGDSKYIVATAGSPDAVRGYDLTCVHLSECAFWPDANTMLAVMQCLPDHLDSFCFMESTANGKVGDGRMFYEEWQRAMSGDSEFIPIFVPWHVMGEYAFPGHVFQDQWRLGIDDAHVITELDNEEQELVKQFHLTADQIAWWRYCLHTKCQGDHDKRTQEYPSCVVADTRISTERGLVRIADAETCKETESGRILGWGEQVSSPVYRLTTRDGRTLDGTADHPIRLADGTFHGLADLVVGTRIQLRAPRFADHPFTVQWHIIAGAVSFVEITEDWGRFLGYFMGDGCWYKGHVSIACDSQDEDVIGDVERVMARVLAPTFRKNVFRKNPVAGCVYVGVQRVAAKDVLERLDLIVSTSGGYWRRKIHVPPCVMQSPKSVVREFLRGLFESDGSSSGKNHVRFYSKEQTFTQDVQLLLLGFGVTAVIRRIEKPNRLYGGTYVGYELRISGRSVDVFYDEIGFVGARKTANRPDRSTNWSRPRPIVFEDAVASVSYQRDDVTYDLTVEGAHVFSANGIETHNTADGAFIQSGLPFFRRSDLLPFQDQIRKGKKYRLEGGQLREDPRGYFEVFVPPISGHQYVVGADSSMGIEDGKDTHSKSTAEILDMETLEQVAEYEASTPPHIQARHLAVMGKYYNQALIAPEVQSSGGGGGRELIAFLKELEYWNLYQDTARHVDKIRRSQGSVYGWETNSKTRPQMIARIRQAINERACLIHSSKLLTQLQNFGENETGRMESLSGHDDLLFAWGIALIVRRDNYIAKKFLSSTPNAEELLHFRAAGLQIQEFDLNEALTRHRDTVLRGPRVEAPDHYMAL